VAAPLTGKRGAALAVATGVRAMVRAYLGLGEGACKRGAVHLRCRPDRLHRQELLDPIHNWFAPHIQQSKVVALPFALYEIVIIGPPAEFARRWLSGAPGLDMKVAMRTLPDTVWRALARG
jgi:hypothetical protein